MMEILLSTTTERDRIYKQTLYGRHGVKAYWLVDPEKREVEVLRLTEKGYKTAGLYGKREALRSLLK